MSRVFITGSSDGLGLMAGQLLAADGHSVTLHARNASRADDTRMALPQADGVVAAAAGPGIRPGAPLLITRQEEVAPLVLAAAGWPPGQA